MVDVLQIPMSYQHNKYLLVVQDYFTKWVEAIPMHDQTAQRITRELIKIFAVLKSCILIKDKILKALF